MRRSIQQSERSGNAEPMEPIITQVSANVWAQLVGSHASKLLITIINLDFNRGAGAMAICRPSNDHVMTNMVDMTCIARVASHRKRRLRTECHFGVVRPIAHSSPVEANPTF